MKKTIAAITLLCYLTMTCGVIVNFHYCMDRLQSWQLFAAETKVCAKCGMNIHASDGCCRDEVKILKVKLDQKTASEASFQLQAPDLLGHWPSQFIAASFINTDKTRHFKNHSPPLLTEQDIYLQNGVFRI